MGIILVIVSIVIIAAAAGVLPLKKVEESISPSSASPIPTTSAMPAPTATVMPTSKPKNHVSINIVSPTITSAPIPVPSGDISDFIYPNSQVVSQNTNSVSLTSMDNPDTIANWYKGKIKSKNMNINTFVTTNVNDQVQDKLVGESATASVSVEIDKASGNNQVTMKVNI